MTNVYQPMYRRCECGTLFLTSTGRTHCVNCSKEQEDEEKYRETIKVRLPRIEEKKDDSGN